MGIFRDLLGKGKKNVIEIDAEGLDDADRSALMNIIMAKSARKSKQLVEVEE
jgi:hypothetical protein